MSHKFDNHIIIHENECYIGQPYTGYALYAHSNKEIIIIGILIQKETFFKTFLPTFTADKRLFHFFLKPQNDKYSDEFIHLRFKDTYNVRTYLK